ncbi:homocysteine methyltransferase [Planococcus antarcticus DSM 14505]|uniref:Homocysteine S-methyltransferase n=1 Tax=Planococcus antarcticus DSM 14505 TaxID=1185653 RepID=A0A1C7DDD6_9BACL|nr:homocysteine S-methyltransferase [Planococcus antarcticus]ANU09427.1 homocysteine S-methyltransferase [Planococcus antarcticus DSM 14505]EIM06057.1 homocysteine methyltransferase [Planococcus antarcticus DSM 14505]
MNPIEENLNNFPNVIVDGAMATELENYGCNLNDRLWSAKILMGNPELIKKVHVDYFQAGADCAITASYQATIEGYKERGLTEEEAIGLIQKSVQIASEARDEFWTELDNQSNRPKPLVAASVGPYGAFLSDGSEYRGDYSLSEDELIAFHKERIRVLVDAGADILACETIPCLAEAKAIGINCSAPHIIESLMTEVKSQTAKPIIVYPNSGEEYDPTSKTWGEGSSENQFTPSTQRWYEAGAQIIGGCCRTTPEDIAGIAAWARK